MGLTEKQALAQLRAEIKRLEKMHAEVVAAKNQTILLLGDVVDHLRASGPGASAVQPYDTHPPEPWMAPSDTPLDVGADWAAAAEEALGPRFQPVVHQSDDEDELIAAFEAGDLSAEDFERALGAVQALNTEIELVR